MHVLGRHAKLNAYKLKSPGNQKGDATFYESKQSMASQPGPLTNWPWQSLGNFKYLLLVPWVANSVYKLSKGGQMDKANIAIFPLLLTRLLHSQLWISVARYKTAQSKHRIVDKSLDFDQVDRERNWDDQIILTALLFYIGNLVIPGVDHTLPWWNTKGVVFLVLLHAGPVEFLYYWFHRALHHHFLYSRYHSHHHASIVTEPITSVIHPFAEELAYFALFAIPLLGVAATQQGSIIALAGYLFYIDFMNYMGHCNFELVPKWLFYSFPPLKYLMYTPSFHSLHHTQFRTNYCLFMPFYDYIYGTMDKSSDDLYERSLRGKEAEAPHVVYLTHMTTLQSVYHLRLGFASLSSKPYNAKWYMWFIWPLTCSLMVLAKFYRSTFTAEINRMKKVQTETWVIPKFSFQYMSKKDKAEINDLVEKAILKADENGARVVALGLLNQSEELNQYGGLYVERNPTLKVKIVDGTSLAAAVILNSIPEGHKEVLIRGCTLKMIRALSSALCQTGIQVSVTEKDYEFLKQRLPMKAKSNLFLSNDFGSKVWLVGENLTDLEQKKAAKGTHFIPCSQFPPKRVLKDCFYHITPAMEVPKAYENMHTCENWLPRRVMSSWRIAGILHALEGWNDHECGDEVLDINKIWNAALDHGFRPCSFDKNTYRH